MSKTYSSHPVEAESKPFYTSIPGKVADYDNVLDGVVKISQALSELESYIPQNLDLREIKILTMFTERIGKDIVRTYDYLNRMKEVYK